MTSAVQVHDEDGIRRVTLARPEKLNALLPADLDAIRDASTVRLGEVRALVYSGAGPRAFSAGMHLDAFQGLTVTSARVLIARVRDCMRAVRTAPVPTICAINGHCLGAAFELALAADLRIAVPHATVGLPEIKVGVPSVVDAALLQQHVGLSKAKEMILTGDLYAVADLAAFGLFNAIVPPEELEGAVQAMLARVAVWSPTVTASQKRLFEIWQNASLVDGAEASLDEFAHVFASEDTARQLREHRSRLGRRRDSK